MNMKMSEAMRVGAKMNPQCLEGHFGQTEDGKITTCAISAAVIAMGILDTDGNAPPDAKFRIVTDMRTGMTVKQIDNPKHVVDFLGAVSYSPCNCPFAKTEKNTNVLIIWHLNDVHHWSREAVAEWVEVIENEIAKKDEKTEIPSTEVVNGKPVLVG